MTALFEIEDRTAWGDGKPDWWVVMREQPDAGIEDTAIIIFINLTEKSAQEFAGRLNKSAEWWFSEGKKQ